MTNEPAKSLGRHERLQWARRNAGYLKPSEAADRFGWTKPTYYGHENGSRGIEPDVAQKYARAFGVNWVWLFSGTGPWKGSHVELSDQEMPVISTAETPSTSHAVEVPAVGSMPRDVPVYGTAIGGAEIHGFNVDFDLNGQIVDYVRRPPGIMHAKGVFAIFVTGESMEPRYEAGDLVYLRPDRPPGPGDDIVIEFYPRDNGDHVTDPGPCFLKRLVKSTADRYICEQFNPKGKLEYPKMRVKKIYRVIPQAELLGV